MLNYLGLLWNPENPAAARQIAEWATLLQRSSLGLQLVARLAGMSVWSAPSEDPAMRPRVLPAQSGVILGTLFHSNREDSSRLVDCEALSEREALQISDSGGRALIEGYWGSYLAFLNSPRQRRRWVMRDCSGWIPCFRTRHEDVDIFFADPTNLAVLRLPPFTFNHTYLGASVYLPTLHIRECGLSGVTELLAGDCVEVNESGARVTSAWAPSHIVARGTRRSYSEAKEALRTTTQHCVSAWASVYHRVLLRLSGGLDSAIVLGCLGKAPAPPETRCFNQCIVNTADDEREYARLAANRARVELVEIPWAASVFQEEALPHALLPKTYPGDVFWWLEYRLFNELAARLGAEAIWTGQGGDHIFLAFRDLPIASDFVREQGLGHGLFRTIDAGARLSNASYASVLREALGHARARRLWVRENVRKSLGHLVNREILCANLEEYIRHPWATECAHLPPGKQAQIDGYADLLNRHTHLPRAEQAYQRHPLQSQPLLELGLQIPTYVLQADGRQRGLARDAFRDVVPPEILARDDKGQTSARVRLMIRQNESFLKELLLNGLLVRERIVPRRPLEQILVEGHPWSVNQLWPLLTCIATELWALSWQRHSLARAA